MGAEFTDSKGRVWRPRLTARTVAEFEHKTSVSFFGAVFDLVKSGNMQSEAAVLDTCAKLFGRMDGVLVLLYEGCRDGRGQVCDNQGMPVALDDFANAIGEDQSGPAIRCAIQAAVAFFPKPDAMAAVGGGSGSATTANP